MSSTRSTQPALDPHVVRIALAVIAGGIAVIFDTTIVSVALDQLGRDLHTSVSTIQWVSTGYLLAMFLAIPTAGWLQARLGGKRLWLAALVGFVAGSVLCALAWNAPSLIAFRAVQGLAGGIMMPLMMTLIMQAGRGVALGRLMAVAGLPIALGPILGPVIGGLILAFLDWHWLFLVNVPVGAVGLTLAWRILPDDRPAPGVRRPGLDRVGLLLVSPGVVGVIYALSNVSRDGGAGRTDVWLPFAVGVVLLAAFARWALRRGEQALVDVRLLRHRPLAVSSLLLFLTGFALYGSMLLLPLYWQQLRGEDALGAGLLLIPQGVGNLLSRSVGGRATDALGPRPVAVWGFVVVLLGTVPFAFAGADTARWWLLLVLLVRGLGLGLILTPIMSVAYVGLEHAEMPDASIITRVMQQLGGSFGVAVLAVVLESTGFDGAFWWASGFTAVAVALSLLLPRTVAAKTAPAEATDPAPASGPGLPPSRR